MKDEKARREGKGEDEKREEGDKGKIGMRRGRFRKRGR